MRKVPMKSGVGYCRFAAASAVLALLCVACRGHQLKPQSTSTPKRFEIYYETGPGDPLTNKPIPGQYDAFDSEKKERGFDAAGGQIRYRAELSAGEAGAIYDAILKNDILKGRKDFTPLGDHRRSELDRLEVLQARPYFVGMLRVEIDGQSTEIRFSEAYGAAHSDDGEWTRFRNVIDVVESILREKDRKEALPPHKAYQ
jgi:hypothetical protein